MGITVIAAVAMAGLIFAFRGPEDTVHAELDVRVSSGDGTWANGNERIEVTHLGGEAMLAASSRIAFVIGATTTSLTGTSGPNALGSSFSDGQLTIGETWQSPASLNLNLAEDAAVDIRIVSTGAPTSSLLAAGTVSGLGFVGIGHGSCAGDTSPPTVSTWIQSPTNVQSIYVGTVTVTAVLSDCTGVAQNVTPHLLWSIVTGGPSGDVTMTRVSTNRWQGIIPLQTYSLYAAKTLQYSVGPLTDTVTPIPNTAATSALHTDAIGPFTTYVNSNSASLGTVTNFANAKADTTTEGSPPLEAALAEALTGASGSVSLLATVPPVSTTGTWFTTSEVVAPDNVYTTTAADANTVRYALGDLGANAGAITTVDFKLEQDACRPANSCAPSLSIDDGWRVRACFTSTYLLGICGSYTPTQTASAAPTDTTLSFNLLALRPGGGTWTSTDINNVEIEIQSQKSGSIDGTWRIDQAYLLVGTIPGYGMDIEFRWTNLPAGTTQTLALNYRTTTDTFSVQVYDPTASGGVGAFTTRGTTLSSATLTPWSYVMTANEYNNGSPRIRFVDTNPAGGTQGNVFIDYARVGTI